MDVKIYRPARSVSQSGRADRKMWVLEFEENTDDEFDFLAGSVVKEKSQYSHIRLKFPTCERAITFSKKHGWNYEVFPENFRKVKPFSFIDRFE